jgi:hypothetical protein
VNQLAKHSESDRHQGQLCLFVAVDGRAAGFIGVIDQGTGDRF